MLDWFGRWPHRALLVCVALMLDVAGAAAADPAALCERAIVAGARNSGVPQEVLHAISLTETGRASGGKLRPWPWAVNREGQGFWFQNREEALAFAKKSVAEGRRSFDVGCFQINYHWHGDGFASVESMFDPEVAAAYAARFLQDLHAESGSWSRAAGAYHSRTPHFANIYRARFDRILADLGGQPLVVAAAAGADEPEAEAGPPRKSRMRMARGPLIIRVERAPAAAETAGGARTIRSERLEKAIPMRVASLAEPAQAAPWGAAAGTSRATGPR